MLTKLPHNVEECLRSATDCAERAERAVDPIAKQSFIDLATRWRAIAETYQYIERVDLFLKRPRSR